jgi:hypothetical protein
MEGDIYYQTPEIKKVVGYSTPLVGSKFGPGDNKRRWNPAVITLWVLLAI